MNKPFIVIASTMRTGSTLVQEMLTELPKSFIFHEPSWSRGMFQNPHLAINALKQHGIDIERLLDHEAKGNLFVFLQKLNDYIGQIGVKEIRLQNWEVYAASVVRSKFILTVRDPRDTYISCWKLLQRETNCGPRQKNMTPQSLFDELKPDYDRQMEIANSKHNWKHWKYEDICSNPREVFSEIATFVDSPLTEMGKVGAFHRQIERGAYETDVHGSRITDRSVSVWKHLNPAAYGKLLGEAHEFMGLAHKYCKEWGYSE